MLRGDILSKPVIFVLLAAIILSGCATQQEIVQVPIAVKPPTAPPVPRPRLPLADIPHETIAACETRGERCGEIMRAWELSLDDAWNWGLEQEILLDGYR